MDPATRPEDTEGDPRRWQPQVEMAGPAIRQAALGLQCCLVTPSPLLHVARASLMIVKWQL